jgi:hypothetical protein
LGLQGILAKRLNTQFGTTSMYRSFITFFCSWFISSRANNDLGRTLLRSSPLQFQGACCQPRSQSRRSIMSFSRRLHLSCALVSAGYSWCSRRRCGFQASHHPLMGFRAN